jgi:hypothetical protein
LQDPTCTSTRSRTGSQVQQGINFSRKSTMTRSMNIKK